MNSSRTVVIAAMMCLLGLCTTVLAMTSVEPGTPPPRQSDAIDVAALARLYPQASDYLWLHNQQLTKQARQALAFIAGASRHGLDPDDYHADLLRQLQPEQDESEAHLFDLVLSDGLLKLAHDMTQGRLDPAIVDPKWSIPRQPFDAVTFLREALSGNNLNASLNSLVPDSRSYRQLLNAAERYKRIVDDGGWIKIPATPLLRAGDAHDNIAVIRQRLLTEGYHVDLPRPSKRNIYDDQLRQAIQQFQRQHSLYPDGIIGPATLHALNVSASARLQHIYINMERLRWLPDDLGRRYILVNLANYRLQAIEENRVKLDMRVIVGKKKRSTPSFSSAITDIVLNPRWYVPGKLARKDLLPKQQRNPDYFSRFSFRVFAYENGRRTEIDPDSVDWQSLSENNFPYTLVQDPGNKNALGHLKFVMPNPWKIYLHDTPSKNLFKQSRRTFSSGCIRVEDPLALADFSLDHTPDRPVTELINSEEIYTTRLEQPLPVYAVYATVWLDGDAIVFSPDSYGRDRRMLGYL